MKKIIAVVLLFVLAMGIAADTVKDCLCSKPATVPYESLKNASLVNYSNALCKDFSTLYCRKSGSKIELAAGLLLMTAAYTFLGFTVKKS